MTEWTKQVNLAWLWLNSNLWLHSCLHGRSNQDSTIFGCPGSSWFSTKLNNIVEHKSDVTILDNIVDNCEQCASKTLFNPVLINLEQIGNFLPNEEKLCVSSGLVMLNVSEPQQAENTA